MLLRKLKTVFIDFFTETTHPMNIAVCRIWFFAFLLKYIDVKEIIWFSNLPKNLQFAPTGSEWLITHFPISADSVSYAYVFFKFFCFMAMIGFFSRFSAAMVAASILYLLGIPQFYGQMTHYHHLFYFSVLLAAGRCGDFLSIDAIGRAVRQADKGETTPPQAASIYTWPLRLMWLLIGIAYFFPGFWKIFHSGYEWVFGDNLKFKLYRQWVDLGDWLPAFRIDNYPILYRVGGALTIFFEVGFIFALLFPRLRMIAVIGGLVFHNVTNALMGIHFKHLQACYVVFFDWARIFQWIGKKLFKESMTVLYDGNCEMCRRTAAILRTVDVLNRIEYVNALSPEAKRIFEPCKLTSDDVVKDMYAVWGNKTAKGFFAYRMIALRMPLLWPLVPFLFLWPVPVIGQAIYRKIADSRSCSIAQKPKNESRMNRPGASPVIVIFIGTFFVLTNILFGFRQIGHGWPFTCYPLFSNVSQETYNTIEVFVVDANGKTRLLDVTALRNVKAPQRYAGMVAKILAVEDLEDKDARFRAMWEFLSAQVKELKSVETVRFYKLQNSLVPEERHLNPIKREMVYEVNLLKSTAKID